MSAIADRSRGVALAALGVLLGGCKLAMDLPPDFLRVQSAPGLRAATPQDATLQVRHFEDADGGTLDFWFAALRNNLVDARGYEVLQEAAVRDAAGRPGKLLRCMTTHEGERVGYLVAVFVIDGWRSDTIRVVEFSAKEAEFQARVDAVQAAIATLRP